MTDLERHALKKILASIDWPSVPGASYDENFRPLPEEVLVEGVRNTDLLDDARFLAGWKACAGRAREYLEFLAVAKPKELVKFAGRPKERSKK